MPLIVKNTPIILLFLIHIFTSQSVVESSSGCQICSETGDCAQAFKNHQGKYCGHFLKKTDFFPCCCPLNSECKVSRYDCNCHVNGNYNYNDYHYDNDSQYSKHHDESSSISISSLVWFILIVICFVQCCVRGKNENDEEYRFLNHDHTCIPGNPPSSNPEVITAEAVVVEEYPKVSYGTVPHKNQSTAQSVGAGVLGAAAGYFLGSAFSGHHGGGHHHGNYTGFSGGYDIAGDSGDGGFDIAGDSGGGGFDVAGDS